MTKPPHVVLRFACALTLIGIGPVSAHSPRPTQTPAPVGPEPEEVARGVFVFPSLNTTQNLVDGNSTYIIGSRAVLVVDAPSPRLTREHLAWLRRRTKLPVTYLVQTHWHPDHTRGTATLKDTFPSMAILASEFTRRIGGRKIPPFARSFRGDFGDTVLVRYTRQATSGRDDQGKPLSQLDVDRAKWTVAYVTRELPDYKQERYVPPTETVESERRIDLGNRTVVIRRYPGHTPGDLVVLVPDAGVVITGDLVVHPVPYGTDETVFRQWSQSLAALERVPGIETIVPGHGEVLHSWSYVHLEREAVDSLVAQANAAVLEGLSYDKARARLDMSRFRELFAGSDANRQWAFDNYFLGYRRAFDEANGLVD
jgi:cyclase